MFGSYRKGVILDSWLVQHSKCSRSLCNTCSNVTFTWPTLLQQRPWISEFIYHFHFSITDVKGFTSPCFLPPWVLFWWWQVSTDQHITSWCPFIVSYTFGLVLARIATSLANWSSFHSAVCDLYLNQSGNHLCCTVLLSQSSLAAILPSVEPLYPPAPAHWLPWTFQCLSFDLQLGSHALMKKTG